MKKSVNRNYGVYVNTEYIRQQRIIDEICFELGCIAYRPNYHAAFPDCNTVLIYTKADHDYNIELEKKWKKYNLHPLESEYKKYVVFLENTDVNGCFNLRFMNRGNIDLRWNDFRQQIKNYILLKLENNK